VLSLVSVEVNPWRYESSDALPEVDTRSAENFVAQMERFERDHPGVAQRLERTLRSCVGYVFFVSPSSIRSAICNFEAFVASMRFMSDRHRVPVWVLLEEAGLESHHLSGFRTMVYEPGIETALASHVATELDGLGLDYPCRRL
jgi:hypothetical protein